MTKDSIFSRRRLLPDNGSVGKSFGTGAANQSVITRKITLLEGMLKISIYQILPEQLLHLYYLQLNQALKPQAFNLNSNNANECACNVIKIDIDC